MTKEKLIIENRTDLSMLEVLDLVKRVVGYGRVSKTSKGKQYCFGTRFGSVMVWADKNKKSDRLVVEEISE